MPLAQLKEPWPLMELVPLDPEVRGAGDRRRRPASPDPHRGGAGDGPRRLCKPRGDPSALRSLAHCPAPPPCAPGVSVQGMVLLGAQYLPAVARRGNPHGVLRYDP